MSHISKLKEVNAAFSSPTKQIEKSVGRAFRSMQHEMNQLLGRYFHEYDAMVPNWNMALDAPAVDVIENAKSIKVTMDLPGIDLKDIDVQARDGFLTIRGERKEETEEDTPTYHCRETSQGEFERTVALPDTADCSKAEANLKNGMLIITMPKKAGALQSLKKIPVKKAA